MGRTNMGRLKEIGAYKNKILELLINDDDIVKALGNNEDNYREVASISDPHDLLFNNIFPYCFVPENQEDQKTYITVVFRFKGGKYYFKMNSIGFYVFAHNDLLKTKYPEMRTDYIINQIDEIFHETQELGLGKLQFSKCEDVRISKYHSGMYLEYKDLSFD